MTELSENGVSGLNETQVSGLSEIQVSDLSEISHFDAMVLEEGCMGIALEDKVAFVEIDGKYEIVKADEKRKAFLLRAEGSKLEKCELTEGKLMMSF